MPLLVGHRGWPAAFPDNSLAGFVAVAPFVDAVELDVRRSLDGKLVLSHDPHLAGFEVAANPWAVLADVDLGGGHRPALLDEVVAALPSTRIDFEVKNHPWEPGFEPDHRIGLEVAERARSRDLVTSFNWDTAGLVQRTFPDVATGIAVMRAMDLSEAIQHSLDAGHRALVPDYRLVLESAGAVVGLELEAWVWTVNDPGEARELADLGVTAIITDDPNRISATWSEV